MKSQRILGFALLIAVFSAGLASCNGGGGPTGAAFVLPPLLPDAPVVHAPAPNLSMRLTDAPVGARLRQMNELVDLYNSRFNLPPSQRSQKRAQLMALQDQLFAKWKSEGGLNKVLEVRNDMMPKLVYTCYTLRDESGALLGLAYEQSRYMNEIDQGQLRVLHLGMLQAGVKFIGINDLPAVRFTLRELGKESGRLSMEFALDVKKERFDKIELELRRTEPIGWILFDPQGQKQVQKAYINFWFDIFARNGGVKSMHLDSRQ